MSAAFGVSSATSTSVLFPKKIKERREPAPRDSHRRTTTMPSLSLSLSTLALLSLENEHEPSSIARIRKDLLHWQQTKTKNILTVSNKHSQNSICLSEQDPSVFDEADFYGQEVRRAEERVKATDIANMSTNRPSWDAGSYCDEDYDCEDYHDEEYGDYDCENENYGRPSRAIGSGSATASLQSATFRYMGGNYFAASQETTVTMNTLTDASTCTTTTTDDEIIAHTLGRRGSEK
mmetsp:Transcript_5977/g.12979  ORF Transcript_5977/g.12979 Transcript_5977/m.12979 type:complete len:235 (+) Transcript_5977:193-897(+)|eukprot:CAMPEP_0168178840 /NCGR_PEP_ID=MMETSP0139_2-20121125/9422_1 /TAXON_ID=44445 /ORGANISM="Pseudo-nitzschia australis, Strain 10249 10 AB" /LENGTH=234 /DNA_ID=CAMNT_0008098425 /DNA_START=213 /DNA_END=917 /DNA_ORIENTATION=+